MESKEFKALRESMGIPKKWIAGNMNVSVATVKRWEGGHAAVFAAAAEMLQTLDAYFEQLADELADAIRQLDPDDRIRNLLCYDNDNDFWKYHPDAKSIPHTAHNGVMKRVQTKLAADSYGVNLVLMDHSRYVSWLDGRKDDMLLRQEWADLQETDRSPVPAQEIDLEENDDAFADETRFALNAGQFRELRTSVGLTVGQLAELMNVETDQVHLWESGDNEPFKKAVEMLFDIEQLQAEMLNELKNFAIQMKASNVHHNMVRLPRFTAKEDLWDFYAEFYPLPVSVYEVAIEQVEKALLEHNIMPAVYNFDNNAYRKWLGARKDTMEMRITWGNLQVTDMQRGQVN